jgi:branched-chain amino acid transport system ATP-binding protein
VTSPMVVVGHGPGPVEDQVEPLLELREVCASYGPYEALFDVSLQVRPGRALALVGANGAGKSTVARVVSGLVPTTRGSIRFAGKDITGRPAYQIARLGLSQLTEGRSVFASLTVEENLTLSFRQALGKRGVPAALERAYDGFPRIGERRNQSAGTLSGGEQRMLALARVLVLHQRLLVVDELSFGLAPVMVNEVYMALERVLASGTSLLLIEQHVDRALELADDVAVLSKGRVVYYGTVAGVEGTIGDLVLGGTPVGGPAGGPDSAASDRTVADGSGGGRTA